HRTRVVGSTPCRRGDRERRGDLGLRGRRRVDLRGRGRGAQGRAADRDEGALSGYSTQEGRLIAMKVRDLMEARLVTVSTTDTVDHAERLMSLEQIRHLLVVDGDLLVGVLSQRDVLAASLSTLGNPDEE